MPEAGSIRGEADAQVSSARPPSPLFAPASSASWPPPTESGLHSLPRGAFVGQEWGGPFITPAGKGALVLEGRSGGWCSIASPCVSPLQAQGVGTALLPDPQPWPAPAPCGFHYGSRPSYRAAYTARLKLPQYMCTQSLGPRLRDRPWNFPTWSWWEQSSLL